MATNRIGEIFRFFRFLVAEFASRYSGFSIATTRANRPQDRVSTSRTRGTSEHPEDSFEKGTWFFIIIYYNIILVLC